MPFMPPVQDVIEGRAGSGAGPTPCAQGRYRCLTLPGPVDLRGNRPGNRPAMPGDGDEFTAFDVTEQPCRLNLGFGGLNPLTMPIVKPVTFNWSGHATPRCDGRTPCAAQDWRASMKSTRAPAAPISQAGGPSGDRHRIGDLDGRRDPALPLGSAVGNAPAVSGRPCWQGFRRWSAGPRRLAATPRRRGPTVANSSQPSAWRGRQSSRCSAAMKRRASSWLRYVRPPLAS